MLGGLGSDLGSLVKNSRKMGDLQLATLREVFQ